MDTPSEDKTPYHLRRDHKRLTCKLALTIAATLLFAWLSLAKMNSRAPVTELGAQMLYVYWALTAWFIICWRRLHRRRESCREALAEIDALPSPAVWALPILTALIGAVGGVVATMASRPSPTPRPDPRSPPRWSKRLCLRRRRDRATPRRPLSHPAAILEPDAGGD